MLGVRAWPPLRRPTHIGRHNSTFHCLVHSCVAATFFPSCPGSPHFLSPPHSHSVTFLSHDPIRSARAVAFARRGSLHSVNHSLLLRAQI